VASDLRLGAPRARAHSPPDRARCRRVM